MEYIDSVTNQYGLNADTVDALYVRQKYAPYCGNRWIEMLPPFTSYDPEELTVPYEGKPSGPGTDFATRRAEIYGIGKELFPITFERRLFTLVDAVMRRSYEIRWNNAYRDAYSKMSERFVVCGDGELGVFMKGPTGCGKTEAIGKLIKRYPKVIRYSDENYGDEKLVPIAFCQVRNGNSDMSALCRNIAEYIDRCIGTPGLYAGKIDSARKLDKRIVIIQNLIREFHIGLLIVDEVQNMDFSSRKAGSVESFLPLLNDTNVGLLFCGTDAAYGKIYDNPDGYLARRFGEVVNAAEYCSNKKEFSFLVENLFEAQWFPTRVTPDRDIVDALFECTGGTIGRLKTLYRAMNMKVLEEEETSMYQGKDFVAPAIDGDFIRKVDEKTMPRMAEILNRQRDNDPMKSEQGNSQNKGLKPESHLRNTNGLPVPDSINEKRAIVLYLATAKINGENGIPKYNPGTIERKVEEAFRLPQAETMEIPALVDKVVKYVTNRTSDARQQQSINPLASKKTDSVVAATG